MNLKKAFLLALIAVSIAVFGLMAFMGYSFVHQSFSYREKMGRHVAARVYTDLLKQTVNAQKRFPRLIGSRIEEGWEDVRVLALLDGARCGLPIRGDLPVGASFADVGSLWEPRRFFGSEDNFLLVRRFPFSGRDYLIGILPDFGGQLPADLSEDGFGLVLCDARGRTLWEHGGSPFFERGWVPANFLSSSAGWHRAPWGEWVWGRAFPIPIGGLRLFVSYPLVRLLPGILKALIIPAVLAAEVLLLLVLLWFYLRRKVLDPLENASRVVRSLELKTDRGALQSDPSKQLYALGRSMENLAKRSSLEELREFGSAFSSSLKRLARVEAEVRAYSDRLREMNEVLDETNREISERDRVWRQTLETSQAITWDGAREGLLDRFSDILLECSGASGVFIGILRGDRIDPLLLRGFDGMAVHNFSMPVERSVTGRALRGGAPLWWRITEPDPHYCPISPAVKSEVNIPLFHLGKAVGSVSLCWEFLKEEDPVLLETLVPLSGYLAGTVDAELSKRELKESYYYLVNRLQLVTAIYHEETASHLARVEAYCRFLSEKLGRSPEEVEDIGFFSRLHDIGKLKVPSEILGKKGSLTADEFDLIQKHTTWGAEILGDADWLAMGRRICLYHHERWDGSGYPKGLADVEIPWEARVMALADVYDALRSPRCYKPPRPHEFAVRVILEGDGRVMPEHFDPRILALFRQHHDQLARIYDDYSEAGEKSPLCIKT